MSFAPLGRAADGGTVVIGGRYGPAERTPSRMLESVALPPTQPLTRAELVAGTLRRQIISGELPAGSRLRQVDIAEQLSVSTTPVREAFTSLAREGLVRKDAHRGVIVFMPTMEEIRENYEIRLALEPMATELAAAHLNPSTLARLDQLLDHMREPLEGPQATNLNREFHRTIYEASHRRLLVQMIERLRDSSEAYVQLLAVEHPPGYYDEVRSEHAAIVAALRARAPRRAHKAMAAHLGHNLAQIGLLLPAN